MQPVTDQLHDLENKIERVTFEAGEKIGSLASTLTNKGTDYKDSTEDFVQQNPLKALAIAAGTGLVVGYVLSVLMRRKD